MNHEHGSKYPALVGNAVRTICPLFQRLQRLESGGRRGSCDLDDTGRNYLGTPLDRRGPVAALKSATSWPTNPTDWVEGL